jgi:ribonuclease D
MGYIDKASVVAIDTEFINFPWYQPKLELIQLATSDVLACVDFQVLEENSKPLLENLFKKTLVVHMAKYDLMTLLLAAGRSTKSPPPLSVFDTQVALAFLGTVTKNLPSSYRAYSPAHKISAHWQYPTRFS